MPNKKTKLSIDRIEEGVIVCFDFEGRMYQTAQSLFPEISEGDIVFALISDGEIKTLTKSEELTTDRKDNLQRRLDSLFSKNKEN